MSWILWGLSNMLIIFVVYIKLSETKFPQEYADVAAILIAGVITAVFYGAVFGFAMGLTFFVGSIIAAVIVHMLNQWRKGL